MGRIDDKKDAITGHIEQRERLRKLEIMGIARVQAPRPWTPDREELDAITLHNCLMSFRPHAAFGAGEYMTSRLHATRLGQELMHYEWEHGYGGSQVAAEFMWFRQGVEVYPHPTRFIRKGHEWQAIGQRDTLGTWDEAVAGNNWTKIARMYPPYSGVYSLIAAGTGWGGTTMEAGGSTHPAFVTPSTWPHPFWDNAGNAIYDYTIGCYTYGSSSPSGYYAGQRNSVYTTGSPPVVHDCGDPGLPVDPGSAVAPGKRTAMFVNVNFNCPNNVFTQADPGTGGIMNMITQDADEFFFEEPPIPGSGQVALPRTAGGLGGVTYQADMGLPTINVPATGLPSFENMRTRIQAAFASGHYPAMQSWYYQAFSAIEADVNGQNPKNWQILRPVAPWRGRIHMRIANGKLTMRGVLTHVGPIPSGDPVILFPHGLIHRSGVAQVFPGAVTAFLGYYNEPVEPVTLQVRYLNGQMGLVTDTAIKAKSTNRWRKDASGADIVGEPGNQSLWFHSSSFPVNVDSY